ncbi:MAG: tetratricopeptide repeat protein [Telluria sp.]
MSLLMQALKKAERAKRNLGPDDDLVKPSEEFDELLDLAPPEPPRLNRRSTDALVPDPDSLTLEPLVQPVDVAQAGDFAPPEVTPALGDAPAPSWTLSDLPEVAAAAHPAPMPGATVPPVDAAVAAEAAAARAAAAEEHAAVGRAAARARRPHPNSWEPDDTEAVHADRVPPPRARSSAPPPHREPMPAPRGPDARTVRILSLLGILAGIVALFGYLYWRAVYGPGSSKHLPPVPMPGLAASTQPADGTVAGAAVPGGGTVTGLIVPAGQPAVPVTPYPPTPAAPVAPPAAAARAETAPPITAPLPSTLGGPAPAAAPPAPAVTATRAAPAVPPQPAPTTIVTNVPRPTPEQMKNLSPEDYSRMDRQAVAEEEAAKAQQQQFLAEASGAAPPAGAVPPVPAGAAPAAAAPAPVQPPVASGAGADVRVAHNTTPAQVNPAVLSAWTAFQSGDLLGARTQYEAVLAGDPANRDALLGLAAVAVRQDDAERAAALYARLLETNPNDPDALAGLASVRRNDPSQAEARLRRAVQQQPEAAGALAALGNLYARQGRWSEAQQQYFKAFAAAPDNADYAYNLAVGLDHLNQPRLALSYYQKALALAGARPAAFDSGAVANRIRALGGR